MATKNSEEIVEGTEEETQTSSTEVPSSNSLDVDTTSTNELFQATLREQYKKNRELQEELERIKNERNKPKEEEEDPWKRFTDNPDNVIAKKVEEQVKPLQEFVYGMKRERDFERVLVPFKSHSTYKQVIEKIGEVKIYEAMNGMDINTGTVQTTLDLIFAAILTGRVPGVTFDAPSVSSSTSTKIIPKDKEVPPTTSPSASAVNKGPTSNTKEPWKDLTETELAFARRNGMSAKEYWESMNQDILIVKEGGK